MGCRHFFARDTWQHFDNSRRQRLCGGEVDLEFVYGGVKDQDEDEYPRINSANHSATLVVMGFGIWNNYFSSEVIPQVFDLLSELKLHFPDPMVIWHAAHARHRFDYSHQSNEDVQRFNDEMLEWSDRSTSMKTINFFNITSSLHAYDGAHYGTGPNRLKSTLLLKFLETMLDS